MNIFIEEKVAQAVAILRRESWTVEYKFAPDDPEYANGYVVDPSDRDRIFAIISSVIRWRKKMTDWDLPEQANSCVQLVSSSSQVARLRELVRKEFSVVEENEKMKDKKQGGKIMYRKIAETKISLAGTMLGSLSFSDRNMSKPDQEKAVYLSLCVNNVCGLGCEHCIAKINRESDDNFEVIAAELNGLGPAELDKIAMASISGLEPTETPSRICYMADFFHQKNIQTILMTNGIELDSRMQNDLAGLIDYFDPSIDGLRSTCKPALKNGGYSKAWANIKSAIDSGFAKKTGIIVTAREENINELPELFHFFEEELGGNKEVCSTLWFYLGADLLPKNVFMTAIKAAVQSTYRQLQIAIPEHYHAYLQDVFAEFGPSDLKYCSQTGVPSVMIEGIKMLLPSLAGGFKAVLRIESDGDIYRGCEHFLGSEENFLGPYHCLKQIISSF